VEPADVAVRRVWLPPSSFFEVAPFGKIRLKSRKYDCWRCPSLTLFEVAFSAAMGRNSGENVVWWCPSLTLRVSISRRERQRRNFKTDASGFSFSLENVKAQLQNPLVAATSIGRHSSRTKKENPASDSRILQPGSPELASDGQPGWFVVEGCP